LRQKDFRVSSVAVGPNSLENHSGQRIELTNPLNHRASMRKANYQLTTILIAATIGGCALQAKDNHPKTDSVQPQDQIVVEAHVANADGAITRFVATRHYNRSYIYAQRAAGQPVTLIDVTNPSRPAVLSNAPLPASSGDLLAVAGTAALTGDAAAEKAATPQTIRIMDFSDPANPKVTKQFDVVTAIEKVAGGVILLANRDGIWILSQHLAEDPEAEKRYARKVVYGESMY
jgi:hypothetical protein